MSNKFRFFLELKENDNIFRYLYSFILFVFLIGCSTHQNLNTSSLNKILHYKNASQKTKVYTKTFYLERKPDNNVTLKIKYKYLANYNMAHLYINANRIHTYYKPRMSGINIVQKHNLNKKYLEAGKNTIKVTAKPGKSGSFYVEYFSLFSKNNLLAKMKPINNEQSDINIDKNEDDKIKADANINDSGKKQDKLKKDSQSQIKSVSSFWRAPQKTRILSIGVSDFEDSSIPKVNYAAKDAQYITSFLSSSGVPQENITCLINQKASRSDILEALSNLKMSTTKKSETAIFYFSGHGAPIIKDGEIEDAALIPYDATLKSLKYSAIKISNLRDILSDTQGNWIVILDACFSGKQGRSLMSKNVKSIAVVPNDYNVTPNRNTSSYWMTSTSGDNFANSFPKLKHGLFTYYLIEALNGERGVDKNKDGLITLEEAFAWTKNKVSSVSKKSLNRPQFPELTGKGDIILTVPR